jgi:protein required for attachment to host cells
MSKLKIKQDEWIVVCDGTKAMILDNVGDELYPSLHVREVRQQSDPPTREQGSDQPGRFFAAVGGMRSAAEQTDWHAETEQAFLRTVTHDLHAAVVAGTVKGVIIIAPPRALGLIRQAWPSTHRDAIKAELAHDYVKLPVDEIERRLFQ